MKCRGTRVSLVVRGLGCVSLGVLLLGCSGPQEPQSTDQRPAVIEVRISDQSVEPNGERVPVRVGQPIKFVVSADTPGELDVHTSPESQLLAYGAGTTTLELKINRPGVVEVESHTIDETIVQLEVR